MEQTEQDLRGIITLNFDHANGIEKLCKQHIPEFDSERFEVTAIRIFSAKEFIVTIYAADKLNASTIHPGKLLVKKFKIETMTLADFFDYIDAFNFTISMGNYDIEEMEVINK